MYFCVLRVPVISMAVQGVVTVVAAFVYFLHYSHIALLAKHPLSVSNWERKYALLLQMR